MIIKTLRKKTGLTQAQFGKKIGVSGAAVSEYENGKSRPDSSRLVQIAQELGVTIDILLGGEMSTKVQDSGVILTGNVKSVNPNLSGLYTHVPFLSARAQAGIATMTFDSYELKLDETYPVFVPSIALTKRHLVIELIGDSMEPEIKNGSLILGEAVMKDDIKYESGGVYAVVYANRFVVRRIKTNEININGTLTLWSDNERYGHITVHSEDITCMWKIIVKVQEAVR